MDCWEGVHENRRLLIAPDLNATGNDVGHLLSLPHPKSGSSTCYFFINGTLQELHWFKQSYGSWFLGNYVCEDGRLYTSTPVDAVFIMLPLFEAARMKRGDDPGKFRQVDEIIYIIGCPGYQHLLSIAENMQVVCEVKEIGSTKFFRLDDAKVLTWLCYKVHQLTQTLPKLDKTYAARDKKNTLMDAVSIIGEYLKCDPWLKLLCHHLKLDLEEVMGKLPDPEVIPISHESTNSIQLAKSGTEKGSTRNGKHKKTKIETNSRNIKEMFSRASRRGS